MPDNLPKNSNGGATPKTRFVIGKDKTQAIYSDRDKPLLNRLEHTEERASHVDPLHPPAWYEWLAFWRWAALYMQARAYNKFGPGHWAIYWKNDVASWWPKFADEAGQPFSTKKEAELFEVALLERDHLRIRPRATLHLETLKMENRNGESHSPTLSGTDGSGVSSTTDRDTGPDVLQMPPRDTGGTT
jgi:hypothetical protein